MMSDFFESEEEELEDFETVELISRYENMVNNQHSTYLSEDDYVNLFLHYTHFHDFLFVSEFINIEMAGMVIRDSLAQYPDSDLLQLFAVYYKYINENLTTEKTLKLLQRIHIQGYEKDMQTYYLANIYAKIGAVNESIALYKKLLEEMQCDEERVCVYSELLFLFDKQEDLPQMLEYYDKVAEINPILKNILFSDLYVHFLYKPDLGVLFFELYVQKYSFSEKGWHCLGKLYSVLLLFEKAVEALENAVALSNDAVHLIALGEVYGAWGDKNKSLEYFHEALSANPKRVDCYLDIADLYYELRQSEQALHYYALALDAFPNDTEILIGTAVTLASLEKYEEAISYLNRIRKTNFVPVEALLLMSDYLVELERNEEAITLFEQMTELYPLVADVWLSYSNYYISYENYTQAYSILRRGMFTMKDNVQLMYRMANYYFLEGKNDRAASFLETAYLIDPKYLDMFLEYDEEIANNPLIMDIVNGLKSNK